LIALASCQPGLERPVCAELAELDAGAFRRLAPGLLTATAPGRAPAVTAALRSRTADDVYVQIWAGPPTALPALLAAPLVVPGEVLAAHREQLAREGRRPQGRVKATCLLAGRSDFRRQDLERRLARALLAGYPGWRLEEMRPDAEFVAFVAADRATVALRVTSPAFRHRGYARSAAALSPTVAAVLVRLAGAAAGDRFLDPCCGGGTILLERAQAGPPYRALIGGDSSEEALDVARTNFGPRHRPWTLQRWDARALPLAEGSVDRAATNLPFGVQSSAEGGVGAFAGACLVELGRVLRPGGRAALLWPAAPEAGRAPGLELELRLPFTLAGQPVCARVFTKGVVPGA